MSSQAEAAGAEEIEMEETGSPSSAVPRTFPSVKVDAPLVDSYTFHSVDAESATESLKGKERAEVEGEWMLGVDEAGRGPVLGPQVYGLAFCKLEYSEVLGTHGFADSKVLKEHEREELYGTILELSEHVKFAATVMSPRDLSAGMLRRNPYNLNAQSHDATIKLISDVLDRGYNVKEAYIDTVGIAADYQAKLSALFPTITFDVRSKADSIFPIVSAASIVAKVTRDHLLTSWQFLETGHEDKVENARVFGSGYPGDPKTISWLDHNLDHVFGYPSIARFSWQTVRDRLSKKAARVKWDDEPSSIQKYFSEDAGAATAKKAPLWKDFALESVGAF